MLTLFAKHARFDLDVTCKGDCEVDFHHTTEDIGIALGQAFSAALGDKKGVTRYGYMVLPMDEANNFCHRLVLHGRAVCVARRPQCDKCVLKEICEHAQKSDK